MDAYYDREKRKEREHALEDAGKAASSAALWGGGFGAVDDLLWGGQRSLPRLAKNALGHAALWGGIGGGASYLGDKLLGPANPADPSAHTKEGAVGGAVGGGIGGAGLGYLLGSGKLAGLEHIPGARRAGRAAKELLPLDNVITDWVKNKMKHPSAANGRSLALGLGAAGLGLGALHGLSAGMDRDTSANASMEPDDESLRQLAAR